MSTEFLKVTPPNTPCELPADMAATYGYPLDPFQQHAIAAISRGENVLVTAKTGSGKTLVGEYQIAHSLRAGRRVFYTTPIKSLSNQKFHDLTKAFPQARVGIMTGDIKFMPDADIIIMTTEILRNLLYKRGTSTAHIGLTASLSLDRLDAVVFDECHYINNKERGKVWEETMILLPPEVKLVLLSATIDRPELFAGWLGRLRERPISLIATTHRVVPLTHYAARINGQELELTEIMATGKDGKEHFDQNAYRRFLDNKAADRRKEREFAAAAANRAEQLTSAKAAAAAANGSTVLAAPATVGKFHQTAFVHQLNTLIYSLKVRDLLPALVFAFSRADCERYAAAVEGSLIDSSDSAAVEHIFDFHLRDHKEVLQNVAQFWTIRGLLLRGLAFHHSGLLPILKEIVEILFSKGLVRILFCTETFAVGINMPTRTAVFVDLKKHDDAGLRLVHTDEYIQMAGRAGRRGKDVRGTVIYLPARDPLLPAEMLAVMSGGMPAIQSKMEFGYEFILKTFHASNDSWRRILNESYWYQQQIHTLNVLDQQLEKARAAKTTLTDKICDELRVRDELEATLRASQNAARKEAQRALDQWKNRHVGPTWETAFKAWPQYKEQQATIARLQAQRDAQSAELTDPRTVLEAKLQYLQRIGFMGPDETLTPKGHAATEINEGHALLMPELYYSGALSALSGQEILSLLAAFLAERQKEECEAPVECSAAVAAAYKALCTMRETLMATEGDPTNDDYWYISSNMIDLIYQWIDGAPAKELCEAYGLYEGNLTKSVLKLSNLYEELTVLATLNSDVDLLEKLKPLAPLIVRDIAIPDSLYLRI